MLKVFLGLFAKPLGAAINNALQAGSAAVLAWSVNKGVDAGIVAPVLASVVGAISLAISGFAATQGVQIPVINADPTNGVKVVDAGAPAPKVNAPNPQ